MAVVLFTQAGVDEAAAFAASLGVYLVSTVLAGMLGGLIYLAQGTLGLRTRGAPSDRQPAKDQRTTTTQGRK
jgi:hypothetical protein